MKVFDVCCSTKAKNCSTVHIVERIGKFWLMPPADIWIETSLDACILILERKKDNHLNKDQSIRSINIILLTDVEPCLKTQYQSQESPHQFHRPLGLSLSSQNPQPPEI